MNIFKQITFFFKKLENFEDICYAEKNAIPLVLPFQEIRLQPELSSPPTHERVPGWRMEILVSNIELKEQLLEKDWRTWTLIDIVNSSCVDMDSQWLP